MEDVLTGELGVISSLKPSVIVVDCSTVLPDSTERMAELAIAGGTIFRRTDDTFGEAST